MMRVRTQVEAVVASNLKYAVVWTGKLPNASHHQFEKGESYVMAVFHERRQAEDWQKEFCPTAGLVCDVVPEET
jgi:hypothetical protein